MRIKGHPLHMMVVHFPSALLPLHLFFGLYGAYTSDWHLDAMKLILLIAVATGWLAAISGVTELIRLTKLEDDHMLQTAIIHAGVNTIVILFFSVLLAQTIKIEDTPGQTSLVLECLAVVALIVGNAFGGSMVTRFLKF